MSSLNRSPDLSIICSASVLCFLSVLLSTTASQAETSSALSIGSLESWSIVEAGPSVNLDDTADNINSQTQEVQNAEPEPVGWDWRQLPLVGDLIDEEGNFQMGGTVPVSVDFDDFEGGTSIIIGEQFPVK